MHMECTHGGGEAEQGSTSVEWSGVKEELLGA